MADSDILQATGERPLELAEQTDGGATRVLVTGAAGRLGSATVRALLEANFEVSATDLRAPTESLGCGFVEGDLLDPEAMCGLLEGIEIVMHIGNHPGLGPGLPQRVFNENMTMNCNVFEGAAQAGSRLIVFASSIQLIGSWVDDRTVKGPPRRALYPLDGSNEPDPSNLYALSKTLAERQLRYYAERCGVTCVALRLPFLHYVDRPARVAEGNETQRDRIEAFSGLTYDDAARLFAMVAAADLEGFRVYQPGLSHRHADLAMPEVIERFYPEVDPGAPDLIDSSKIEADTGWRASDDYTHTTRASTKSI